MLFFAGSVTPGGAFTDAQVSKIAWSPSYHSPDIGPSQRIAGVVYHVWSLSLRVTRLRLPQIAYSLEIQASSSGSCRLEVTGPGSDGFDDRTRSGKLFLFLIRPRHAGLDQSYFHGCPAPLLVTAKAFESTSRTLVMDRAVDSASAFCAEVRTLPVSFTSPL